MVRSVLTAVVTAVFLLYSQSLLVMWCLYFVEKHDIVLYFCPEELGSENPFAGARYVHELSDAHTGKGHGALVLLTIVERSIVYLPTDPVPIPSSMPERLQRGCTTTEHPTLGYPQPPFIPPRTG
jgi:hypothetical protein